MLTRNKTGFMLVVILFIVSKTTAQLEHYNIENERRDFKITINKSLPEFTFSFIFSSGAEGNPIGISRIEIRRGTEKRILQTIKMENPQGSFDYYSSYSFGTIDLNFDEYLDILLVEGNGGSGGDFPVVWLYDPQSAKFKIEPQFEGIGNLSTDPETKTIISDSWGGVWSKGQSVYRFEGKKLILIHEENEECNEIRTHIIRTIKDYEHGKVISVVVDSTKAKEE